MIPMTQLLIRTLQKVGERLHNRRPRHLVLGQHGETEAYFYLKRQGYRIVATNFRAPNDRGEIDLIGWDEDRLCFIEVKTRTDDSFAPPSTAVTPRKQERILSVAKRYLRHMSGRPACRFDILSVVPMASGEMKFSLQKGAFTWHSTSRRRRFGYFGGGRF